MPEIIIVANVSHKLSTYTYTDYLTWPEDERWELINGRAYRMAPAPNIAHQSVVQNLARIFGNQFRGTPCRTFLAPTDVKLSETDVVQPDLLVVCDSRKLGEQAILGAPDLVVEVISPASEVRDRREKFDLYARFGVAEYWIVSPHGFVEVHSLKEDGLYGQGTLFAVGEKITSYRFPELDVAVDELFDGIELPRYPQPSSPTAD